MRRAMHWGRPAERLLLSPALRSWLLERGSLTARCQAACGCFAVRVLRSGGGFSLMGVSGRPQRPWVAQREVLLECDGRPVIFAHTELAIAPRGRLSRWLAGLGSRSLGSLLFAHPAFRRGAIECIRLRASDMLHQRASQAAGLQHSAQLWARRSRHTLGGQSVVVTEVFLPAILDLR